VRSVRAIGALLLAQTLRQTAKQILTALTIHYGHRITAAF
jgi:hypothetical protein